MYLFLIYIAFPFFESGSKETFAPPGSDNTRFDPIAAIRPIQNQIGEGVELVSMSSSHVKSDGTQDLVTDLYYANTDYEFVREVPTPDNAPPIGAGGSVDGHWYQVTDVDIFSPGQWRNVSGSENYSYLHKGMNIEDRDPVGTKPDTLPIPLCPFATLWEGAIADGAPASAVATIGYDEDGYRFFISGTSYNVRFDRNCRLTEN